MPKKTQNSVILILLFIIIVLLSINTIGIFTMQNKNLTPPSDNTTFENTSTLENIITIKTETQTSAGETPDNTAISTSSNKTLSATTSKNLTSPSPTKSGNIKLSDIKQKYKDNGYTVRTLSANEVANLAGLSSGFEVYKEGKNWNICFEVYMFLNKDAVDEYYDNNSKKPEFTILKNDLYICRAVKYESMNWNTNLKEVEAGMGLFSHFFKR